MALAPIHGRAELVGFLEAGCKPRDQWRIGTEHEKLGFRRDDLRPLTYEGPSGVYAVMAGLQNLGWDPVSEAGQVIALRRGGESITLEPGGQFELAGAPLENLHETCREVQQHLEQVRFVTRDLGVGFLGIGFQPKWGLADTPIMPKARYEIMRRYMPTRGGLGLDMMFRSCTVQVNVDFSSEADMVRKFRVSLALQPIATALFANSPFCDGQPNGYQSYRSQLWTDTDPDRCGMLPFVFEEGMGFERYVDYLLDVPMYFVRREGVYIDAAGQSFRAFLEGRLPALPGELPSIEDWSDHVGTVFPEVRLKRFLEMRGADGGPWKRLCALPALWVGLLYDDQALAEAEALVADWSQEELAALRAEVPSLGLQTPFRDELLQDVAGHVVDIATAGLERRDRRNRRSETEAVFLNTLHEIADSGLAPAQKLLDAFHGPWKGSVDPLFEEQAY